MEPIIQVKDVSFRYEGEDESAAPVLDHVSLEIEAGSFVVILGHNGSGKSTLAKHLNGILAKHTGKPLKTIEKDTDRDFFMSADEAVKYGLVDDVLGAAPAKA